MKAGLGWFFRGSFEDPPRAQSWSDSLSSQASPDTLEESGNSIVIVALYAHPLLLATEFHSVKDSIREQIQEAQNFVLTHPRWIIARSSSETREALSEGKKVLILSLEGAGGVLDSPEDIAEFIDRDGIRIVTVLHLTDDEFGGAAFLKGIRAWSSPFAYIKSWFHSGPPRNPEGLTAEGKKLLDELIEHHVWIDLSHSSDRAQEAIIPVLNSHHLPLLYTHTVLRKYFGAERAITPDQLAAVRDSHGFLGLISSEEMLEGTPALECPQGIAKLALQFKEVMAELGPDAVSLGTDFNGALNHLKPGCAAAPSIQQKGLVTMAQTPQVWAALKELGVPVSSTEKTIGRFLEDWALIEK